MILIISDQDHDGHVASVRSELSRRGEEFRIFDPATYPESSTLTLESVPTGVRAFLSWDGSELDLTRVKSVWYRRPGPFALSDELTAEEDKWVRCECDHLFRGVWGSLHGLWVSYPDAIKRSSVKMTQLDMAMKMGFCVPRFTVTNDVDVALQFISSCDGGVVVKVLANPAINYSEQACTLYTHLISKKDCDLIDSVRFGPTFLQEFVEKSMDVRVTVFGEELFAVGIESTFLADARVDFRRANIYDLPHVVLTLPEGLQSMCISMVRRLGLNFGAIDLILTSDGRYLFLEINPNGQWYWLEWVTGVPMTKSLCNLLVSGSDREESLCWPAGLSLD